jgi:macrodomain Ter protein organizer (MatP/YcbG family)
MPSGVYERKKPGERGPVRVTSIDWPYSLWQRISAAAAAEKPKISFRAWIIDAAERKLARKEK